MPALAVIAGFALTACSDSAVTQPTLTPKDALLSASATGSGLDRAQLALPSSWRLTDQRLAEVARRAIDPNSYVCPASTPVIDWFITEARKIDLATRRLLILGLAADLVPTYETLVFQTSATPQYFGYNGQYTKTMLKTERDVKRFWDIASDDIQLLAMHGTVLTDVDRVAATYQAVFGVDDPAEARGLAEFLANIVESTPALNGGNHPLFTFNAFAFSAPLSGIPDKIVMGDGVLEGFSVLGFGDVAPQAIYAHEFAHHIQFENDYFDDPLATAGDDAEDTRYTELMADAMAAYYLTHKRGGTLNRKRVQQFLQVFFQLGDCGFASAGHHGTPNQRLAAAQFGFDVADQAQKQGHILTSEQFHDLFVAYYPTIVAPDVLAAGAKAAGPKSDQFVGSR
jgi:hypothetical protein